MIENESKHVTEKADQVFVTKALLIRTTRHTILEARMVNTDPAQIGNGSYQETMFAIDHRMPGAQLGRQVAGIYPVGNLRRERACGLVPPRLHRKHPQLRHFHPQIKIAHYKRWRILQCEIMLKPVPLPNKTSCRFKGHLTAQWFSFPA